MRRPAEGNPHIYRDSLNSDKMAELLDEECPELVSGDGKIPVTIITGMLGRSGTVLRPQVPLITHVRNLLQDPERRHS